MKALCFGSLNIDYTYLVPHFVSADETLASTDLQSYPGGKGLNQAIALARAGMEVWMAGAIGGDGRFLMDELRDAGIHTELLCLLKEQRTGHSIIQRREDGANCILLYGGANRCITAEYIDRAMEPFGEGDLLVVQNEINAVPDIIHKARARGMRIALNPSPMDDVMIGIPAANVDFLLLNLVEARQLLALPDDTDDPSVIDALAERLSELQVVLTLGDRGAVVLTHGRRQIQPAYSVTPVDTTAAGDTFTGYYLAAVTGEATIAQALQLACKAASVAVTRHGASTSIPMLSEVETQAAEEEQG